MGENKSIILLVIIIGVFIIVSIIFFNNGSGLILQNINEHYSNDLFKHIEEGKENYYWEQLKHGKRSTDCYKLNKKACLKFSNCGLCLKDGKMECIPGDEHGPLFKDNCENWVYTNYYDRYIFGEKVTSITRPWSMFYPDYEVRLPSPTSRSALFY